MRDVCQGPVEFLLALEHDATVKEILRLVFAQQYLSSGDWPQWFMLDPYAIIQDRVSHGDVIVWPLKALNDYIETTGDFAFLDEPVAWRADDLERTTHRDSIAAHVAKLVEAVRARFIPGTHLIRYGEGDWNDSLQPVDPLMRDRMVSSWTVALLFQQLRRAAEIYRRAGRVDEAQEFGALADAMRADFNAHLMRDETVAGYAIFAPAGGVAELLLHPSDARTGLSYSLLPMTRSIIGGLFTPEQTRHHLKLIREHLTLSRWRAADGPAGRLSGRPANDFPARRIGVLLRPRNRAHVYARASALRRSHVGAWRFRYAVRRAGYRQSNLYRRQNVAGAPAPAQRVFQQLRRRLSRSRQRQRAMGPRQGGNDRV